jgi:hypothetical protein
MRFMGRDNLPTHRAARWQMHRHLVGCCHRQERLACMPRLSAARLLVFGQRRLYWFLAIPIAAGWLVAVSGFQSLLTLQLEVLGRQAGILGLQSGVLRSQIGHFRLQLDNLSLKSSQSLAQGCYFWWLLSDGDNLLHFPYNDRRFLKPPAAGG